MREMIVKDKAKRKKERGDGSEKERCKSYLRKVWSDVLKKTVDLQCFRDYRIPAINLLKSSIFHKYPLYFY